MKQISGYVLIQGSNVGVPNLVVSAHDVRDVSESAASERTLDGLARQLGRRLGSVLTDASGRFVLSGEDLQFEGNEARPNLALTVSAPEDVRSAEKPTPLSPELRLLYISAMARRDAGAEEAFVIRLLPAQLEKFGITTAPSAGQATTSASKMADTLQAGFDASDLLRERFKTRLNTQVTGAHNRHAAAKNATKNLSGIPAHLRGANNVLQNNKLLIPDRDSLTQLPDVQKTALTQGLTRLKSRKSPPVIRLYLTPAEIKDLKLEVDNKGHVTGEAKTKVVMTKVRQAIKGYSLIRTRGSSTVSVEDLQRKYLQTPLGAKASARQSAQAPVATKTQATSSAALTVKSRADHAAKRSKKKATTK
jgi:hypothetical protein